MAKKPTGHAGPIALQTAISELVESGKRIQAHREAMDAQIDTTRPIETLPRREFEYCATCGGELDTGWQCNTCGLDWRDWVFPPFITPSESEQ